MFESLTACIQEFDKEQSLSLNAVKLELYDSSAKMDTTLSKKIIDL